MRILSVLGQKPGMTGSGVLVNELWQSGVRRGDSQLVIVAAYPEDDYSAIFNSSLSLVTYSNERKQGELPFPILGMSDVMPYPALRYSQASTDQIEAHLAAFRSRLQVAMADFRPDVIHIHHLWVLASLAGDCSGKPCFVTVHGTDLKQLKVAPQWRPWVEWGIQHVKRFFCVSRDILKDTQHAYGIPFEKLQFMGNGYNESIFRTDGPTAACQEPVVCCAGKFVPWKGFRFVIRACGRLSRSHRLVIAGTGPEAERQSLLQEAELCGMSGRLSLTGHLSQDLLAQWFRRADVFALPSIYEPFGLVLLEALACGCPVIATPSGGPKDIVSESLLRQGYATLVPPLRVDDPADEERYVGDLCRALQKHLSRSISQDERSRISDSVSGLEWDQVYRLLRSEYSKALLR